MVAKEQLSAGESKRCLYKPKDKKNEFVRVVAKTEVLLFLISIDSIEVKNSLFWKWFVLPHVDKFHNLLFVFVVGRPNAETIKTEYIYRKNTVWFTAIRAS